MMNMFLAAHYDFGFELVQHLFGPSHFNLFPHRKKALGGTSLASDDDFISYCLVAMKRTSMRLG